MQKEQKKESLNVWGSRSLAFGRYAGLTYKKVYDDYKSYIEWAIAQKDPSGALQDFVAFINASKEIALTEKEAETHSGFLSKTILTVQDFELSQESLPDSLREVETSQNTSQAISVVLALHSSTHFTIYAMSPEGKMSTYLPSHIFSLLAHLKDNACERKIKPAMFFLAKYYSDVIQRLKDAKTPYEAIPDFVLIAFQEFRVFLSHAYKIDRTSANILTHAQSPEITCKINSLGLLLGSQLLESLKPFQLEGVLFGLRNHGRCLLGDEMGLGKTLQGLGIAAAFSDEWPCLIVTPSSLTLQWRDQVLQWLPHLVKKHQVFLVRSGKDIVDTRTAKMIICSYDLIKKKTFPLRYDVVICDECHYIKNLASQRASRILPLVQQAKRVILLSGTPALNKPTELYTQVFAVIPHFASIKEFSIRYAAASVNPWTHRPTYSGHRLSNELHLFLSETIMIRRLKRDVQAQLPPKMRSRIPVSCSRKEFEEIKMLIKSHPIMKEEKTLQSLFTEESGEPTKNQQKNVLSHLFQLTGMGKIKPVTEHLHYLLRHGCSKLLVFAHHRNVLDQLEQFFNLQKVKYVRVDGAVSYNERQIRIQTFQNQTDCAVALLSITACGHGLNLTAAGTVVFAELYWVPGVVVQAEDRSHRMGTQHSCINIHYLIAEDTVDEIIWRIIEKKWVAVTSTLNGQEETYTVSSTTPEILNTCAVHQDFSSFVGLATTDTSSQHGSFRKNDLLTESNGVSGFTTCTNTTEKLEFQTPCPNAFSTGSQTHVRTPKKHRSSVTIESFLKPC